MHTEDDWDRACSVAGTIVVYVAVLIVWILEKILPVDLALFLMVSLKKMCTKVHWLPYLEVALPINSALLYAVTHWLPYLEVTPPICRKSSSNMSTILKYIYNIVCCYWVHMHAHWTVHVYTVYVHGGICSWLSCYVVLILAQLYSCSHMLAQYTHLWTDICGNNFLMRHPNVLSRSW